MNSYLVLGLGRFGQSIAETLVDLGHDILAVDNNQSKVNKFSDIASHVLCAECEKEDFLKSLGIKNFDAVVVAVGNDIKVSVLTVATLKDLGAKFILAKAQDKLHARVLRKIGADKVVLPEREMAVKAANNLVSKRIIDMIQLSNDYTIMETAIPVKWAEFTIEQLDIRSKYNITVLAIRRNGQLLISPGPLTKFSRGDVVCVMGTNKDLNKLSQKDVK